MSAVHQFVAAFEPGAVGQHMLEVRRALREWGFESEIFAGEIRPFDGEGAHHYQRYGAGVAAQPDDVLLYHLAIGSEVAGFLAGRPERLLLWYHNLTPPEFFERWEPAVVPGVEWGRAQLVELADRCLGALAVSRFNQLDLDRAGYEHTAVVPILRDCTALRRDIDEGTSRRLEAARDGGGVDAVFVGRIVPNKAQHDLVKLVATYEKLYGNPLRMHLVGSAACVPYAEAVEAYAARLGVAARVHVTGAVTPAELAAYYRAADVFVSASEHEGFCVPVIEALACDTPVVAFAAAAVPETLRDGGIALPTKASPVLAAAVHRVVSDETLRADLRARGAQRVQAFDRDLVAQQLRRTLTAWGVAPR